MRELFFARVFSGWKSLSVRQTIFLSMAFVAIAGAWLMTGVSIAMLRSERARQNEIATKERAFSQASSARLILENFIRKKQGFGLDKEKELAKNFGLSRWPSKNDIFIGVKGENAYVVWQDKAKGLVYADFSEMPNPWQTNDAISYWFTKNGALIQSNSLKIEGKNFSERRLFRHFALKGSHTGSTHFTLDQQLTHASYHEVFATNVFVGVESVAPVAPPFFVKLFLVLLVVSLLLIAGAFVLSMFASDYVRRVFYETTLLLRSRSSSDLKSQLDASIFPEAKEIFELVHETNNSLESRLIKLESVQYGLRALLEATVEMHSLLDKYKIVSTAADLILKNVSCSSETNCWAYLVYEKQPDSAILYQTAQIIARGLKQEGPLFLGPLAHPIESTKVLSDAQPYIDPETQLLLIPILHQRESLGFLVVEGFNSEKLSEFDLFLLRAVSLLTGSALMKYHFLEERAPGSALTA